MKWKKRRELALLTAKPNSEAKARVERSLLQAKNYQENRNAAKRISGIDSISAFPKYSERCIDFLNKTFTKNATANLSAVFPQETR